MLAKGKSVENVVMEAFSSLSPRLLDQTPGGVFLPVLPGADAQTSETSVPLGSDRYIEKGPVSP